MVGVMITPPQKNVSIIFYQGAQMPHMKALKIKPDNSKKHILLIEDNPGDARLVQEMPHGPGTGKTVI